MVCVPLVFELRFNALNSLKLLFSHCFVLQISLTSISNSVNSDTFPIVIGDEPEKYGFPDDPNIDDEPSTNRVNQNKVTLYRYSDRFYYIRKDPHSPSPIPLITNQTASNLLTQNLVNTQELHKRHIRRKAEFKKCVLEMLKAMQQDERPRYDTVKMLRGKQSVVHSEIPCSVKIGRLYEWVKQSYDSAHPGNSGCDIKGELKDHGDGVREQCEAYFPAIKVLKY